MTERLEELKEEAKALGISVHHNIGEDTLQTKIDNFKAVERDTSGAEKTKSGKAVKPATKAEIFAHRKKEAAKLIRVIITCLDPNKKAYTGELFSIGSAKLGTFKKFVQFGKEYHIPAIMYWDIKDRLCKTFYTENGPRGNKVTKTKMIPAYAINVLDPLTEKELEDLAKQQAMRGAIDEE